jgi:hypothetical protein
MKSMKEYEETTEWYHQLKVKQDIAIDRMKSSQPDLAVLYGADLIALVLGLLIDVAGSCRVLAHGLARTSESN